MLETTERHGGAPSSEWTYFFLAAFLAAFFFVAFFFAAFFFAMWIPPFPRGMLRGVRISPGGCAVAFRTRALDRAQSRVES